MAETTVLTSSHGCGLCGFMVQFLRGRWFMMFATFLIMSGSGATYIFGAYSKAIKSSLGYDQSTLNILGSCKDLGATIGVLSGLLAEVTPSWFVLLVGALMNFSGYFLVWLAVTKRIPKPPVWQMCVYICIGANSQNFANTGSLVPCVKNFPERRGMMLGLMKGFVGLSGAIFTQLYLAIYHNDAKDMILLIGWLPAVISLVFLFLMALTIAQDYFNFSHADYVASATGVCVLLFLPSLCPSPRTPESRKLSLHIVPQIKEEGMMSSVKKVVAVETSFRFFSVCVPLFLPPLRIQRRAFTDISSPGAYKIRLRPLAQCRKLQWNGEGRKKANKVVVFLNSDGLCFDTNGHFPGVTGCLSRSVCLFVYGLSTNRPWGCCNCCTGMRAFGEFCGSVMSHAMEIANEGKLAVTGRPNLI